LFSGKYLWALSLRTILCGVAVKTSILKSLHPLRYFASSPILNDGAVISGGKYWDIIKILI
jgi:hypothetical protein